MRPGPTFSLCFSCFSLSLSSWCPSESLCLGTIFCTTILECAWLSCVSYFHPLLQLATQCELWSIQVGMHTHTHTHTHTHSSNNSSPITRQKPNVHGVSCDGSHQPSSLYSTTGIGLLCQCWVCGAHHHTAAVRDPPTLLPSPSYLHPPTFTLLPSPSHPPTLPPSPSTCKHLLLLLLQVGDLWTVCGDGLKECPLSAD